MLKHSGLFKVTHNVQALAHFLMVDVNQLWELMESPNYQTFSIPKKKGGKREIVCPAENLKFLQRKLNEVLQYEYSLCKPKQVHGFVQKKSYKDKPCNIVSNAQAHAGKKFLLNMDVKDFFPSISAGMVRKAFMSKPFNFDLQVANYLTLLTTYQGKLPTGAPTSPIISNFVCLDLDADLQAYCKQRGLTYTRYADDLSFSTNTPFSNEIEEITAILAKHHFKVNPKKLRIVSQGAKQEVTGLVVNQKANVDRRLIRRLRAILHDLELNGIEKAAQKTLQINDTLTEKEMLYFRLKVKGLIDFVGQVRGKDDMIYLKLNYRWSMAHRAVLFFN